jgi:hypothetical protein
VKMHTAASDKASCTQNTTSTAVLGTLGPTRAKIVQGVLAADGAEAVVLRLPGQDDGADFAHPLELGGLEIEGDLGVPS